MGSGPSRSERKRTAVQDAAFQERLRRLEQLYAGGDDKSINTIQDAKTDEDEDPMLTFDKDTGIIDHHLLGKLHPHPSAGGVTKRKLQAAHVHRDVLLWKDKRSVIPSLGVFKDIDRRAINAHQASDHLITSPKDLVYYLVSICRNELERFRAIYRWVASHVDFDVQHLNTGRSVDSSAQNVFKKCYAVADGYCKLLDELCKYAGIESQTVLGACKGVYFCPGDYNEFKPSLTGLPTSHNHSWTIVTIYKRKYLCDVTWAAGTVERLEESGKYVFHRQWKEDYFLAEPESFLERHWPMDEFGGSAPYYQLLDRPFTVFKEWGNRPLTDCDAYNLNVSLTSHKSGVIKMENDAVEIKFTSNYLLHVRATLTSKSGHLSEALRYRNYAVVSHWNGEYTVHVRLPTRTNNSGQCLFVLNVYGQLKFGDEELKDIEFFLVKYVLVYPGKPSMKAFPGSIGNTIGLSIDAFVSRYEILSHTSPIIKTDDSKIAIEIATPSCDPVEFSYYLARAEKPEMKLLHDSYVERCKDRLVCHIRLYAKGEHFFILRATISCDAREEWVTLCSFVLRCPTPLHPEIELPFPIHGRQWGPTSAFFREGFQVYNQNSSTIATDEKGKCNLLLKRPNKHDLHLSLRTHQNVTHPLMGQIICQETVDDFIRLKLRIPDRGQYKLVATGSISTGEDKMVLMTYLITCQTPFSGELYPEHWDLMGPLAAFEELEMSDMCGHCSTKQTKDGQRTLSYRVPPRTYFYFRLRDNDGGKIESCHFFGYLGGGVLTVMLRLPKAGHYTFGLYQATAEGKFVRWVAHFMIKCDKPFRYSLFPQTDSVIGPIPMAQELDVLPYDKDFNYFLKTNTGKCQARFMSPKPLRCYHKLKSHKGEWNQFVFGEIRNSKQGYILSYRFELPQSGYYSFSVWCKDDDDKPVQIVAMMIYCEKQASPCLPFFDRDEAWLLGLREDVAKKLGIVPENVSGGSLYSNREGTISLSFILEQPLFQFWCNIEGAGMSSKHLTRFIKLATEGNKTVVILSPPVPGRYKASFSGRLRKGDEAMTPFTCLIQRIDHQEHEGLEARE